MSPTSPTDGTEPVRDGDDGVISPLRFLSGGLEFAVTCTLGALGGRWLDARLGTDPWLTAVLLIVAFASATWMLLRRLAVVGPNAAADRSSAGNSDRESDQT